MYFLSNLDEFFLLKHPFYQAWTEGKLSLEVLQEYVCQYYNHVKNFPRYLSTMHSICDDIKIRKVILGNLIDEEHGDEDHPELLLRFAEGIGLSRKVVINAKLAAASIQLDDIFFSSSRSSVAEGVGALFAYERQIPEVAKSKIMGLKEFYNIDNDFDLKFFSVHISADEWHSEECKSLIESMSEEDQKKAGVAALLIAKALWNFLDEMETMRLNKQYLNII